jgi:hypothetical protein
MRARLLLLLALPLWTCGIPAAQDEGDTPSLELLEYLAEYAEDENGRLWDPIEQADQPTTRSYSYREYMQERTDR